LRTKTLLGAALVASLALNAYALWPRERPAAAHGASAPREEKPAPEPRAGRTEAEALRTCEARLKAKQATEALRSLADGIRGSRAADDDERAEAERPSALRCRIAEKQLRDRWREKEEETLADVRESLSDAKRTARDAAADAERYAERLGATGAQRERFAERYLPIRRDRMARILAAIEKAPVDYAAALAEMKGLYADEDALVADLFGRGKADAFAADAEEGRLTVLTIIAALGALPLPDGVRR
jgi:hypothetical protein